MTDRRLSAISPPPVYWSVYQLGSSTVVEAATEAEALAKGLAKLWPTPSEPTGFFDSKAAEGYVTFQRARPVWAAPAEPEMVEAYKRNGWPI